MRDWNQFFTEQDFKELIYSGIIQERRIEIAERANKILREAIEAAPKVHGNSEYDYGWTRIKDAADDMSARIVNVKRIEKGEA